MIFVNSFLVTFSRALRKPVGILNVKVLRATKLKRKDMLGKSDPYVKLKLTEDKLSKKTTVKHSNLNPEWNEEFNLVVKDPESQSLELACYDWEQVSLIYCFSCVKMARRFKYSFDQVHVAFMFSRPKHSDFSILLFWVKTKFSNLVMHSCCSLVQSEFQIAKNRK